MQSHRDKMMQKRRRQHLQRILQQQRKNYHIRQTQQEQTIFKNIYPKVTQQNYHKYKSDLADLVTNNKYSYQISVFAPIVHDFLIENIREPETAGKGILEYDYDSWKIIKWISQFQDVQIPQTEEFVHVVVSALNANYLNQSQLGMRVFDAIVICANLLDYPKYQSLFRDRLIQNGLLERIYRIKQKILNKDIQKVDKYQKQSLIMIAQILCSMLFSQPILPLAVLQDVLDQILHLQSAKNPSSQESKAPILQSFPQIRQRLRTNKKYAELLMQKLEQFIISEWYGGELYVLDILSYMVNSGVTIQNQKIFNLMLDVVLNYQAVVNVVIVDGVLEFLQVCIKQLDIQIDIQEELIEKLFQLFIKSPHKKLRQHTILQILNTMPTASAQVYETLQKQQKQTITLQLIDCLQNKQVQSQAALLLKTFIQYLGEKNNFRYIFESLGGKRTVEKLCEHSKEDNTCLDGLLGIIDKQQQDN